MGEPADVPFVIMAKVPVPGRVKTRLIPLFGANGAAELCRAMTADVVASVRDYGVPWRIALDGDPSDPWFRSLEALIEPQVAGDLGARLKHALRGGGIAIGTDAPTLGPWYLRAARTLLGETSVVFGPAFDGGYVLVGARPDALAVFDGIPWSSPDTYAASHTRAVALGLRPSTLPFWYDVDEPRDVTFLRNHLRTYPSTTAPRTRAVLEDLPEILPDR